MVALKVVKRGESDWECGAWVALVISMTCKFVIGGLENVYWDKYDERGKRNIYLIQ